MRTVLITGIGGYVASLVAGALASQPNLAVIGVAPELPPQPLDGVRLQQCDMSANSLLQLLEASAVDVVVHLDGVEPRALRDDRRGYLFRTVELLGACAQAGVRRVVLRSSTLVYGARPDAPLFIDERAPVVPPERAGAVLGYAEVERVAAEFAARHPALSVAPIRCAGIVGEGSPLERYLRRRPAPVMLGFDPRIQVLHAQDAALAFALAALADGLDRPVNVAASPPLPLSRAILLAGGRPLPLPPGLIAAAELRRHGQLHGVSALLSTVTAPVDRLLDDLPFNSAFLRYGCVADTRRAAELLGWEPQHSAEETLGALAAAGA